MYTGLLVQKIQEDIVVVRPVEKMLTSEPGMLYMPKRFLFWGSEWVRIIRNHFGDKPIDPFLDISDYRKLATTYILDDSDEFCYVKSRGYLKLISMFDYMYRIIEIFKIVNIPGLEEISHESLIRMAFMEDLDRDEFIANWKGALARNELRFVEEKAMRLLLRWVGCMRFYPSRNHGSGSIYVWPEGVFLYTNENLESFEP